jgi:uncharacterized membrane protein (DUF4010 family)
MNAAAQFSRQEGRPAQTLRASGVGAGHAVCSSGSVACMDDTSQLLPEAAIALGIGLMIGLEREHHEHAPGASAPAVDDLGLRSFALLALLGWLASYLGATWPWLVPTGLIVTGAVGVIAYQRGGGLTTAIAGIATYALGVLVRQERLAAVSLGVVVVLLLISKPWVTALVPRLRRVDLLATLQLLVVLAVILPLLPLEARDPWHVLSPRRIGYFVTMIAGIDFVGYVLSRVLGPRRGAGVLGLVGGLASSTALTAAMAREGRTETMRLPAQLAIFLASLVMCARVLVLAGIFDLRVALAAVPALATLAAAMLGGAIWKWIASRADRARTSTAVELPNPMSLLPALRWGLIMAVVTVLAAAAQDALGARGVIGAAALAGLVDLDAITLAVSRQAAAGALAPMPAMLAVAVATAVNTMVKAGIAWGSGGRRLGGDVAKIFALGVLASGVATAIVWTAR